MDVGVRAMAPVLSKSKQARPACVLRVGLVEESSDCCLLLLVRAAGESCRKFQNSYHCASRRNCSDRTSVTDLNWTRQRDHIEFRGKSTSTLSLWLPELVKKRTSSWFPTWNATKLLIPKRKRLFSLWIHRQGNLLLQNAEGIKSGTRAVHWGA